MIGCVTLVYCVYNKSFSFFHRQVNMGTNFVMLNVTAGETVWPEYLGDSDSARIWGDRVTTFSGFLLHEL